jgi:hypothetical protein
LSKQPTTVFEREGPYRAMMQAHARAEALERRLRDERRREGIEPLLDLWLDAAGAIRVALGLKRSGLLREGNAPAQLDRIDQRLAGLFAQAEEFVLAADLETGAASWQHLAHEVASLSGRGRDAVLRFVVSRKDEVDDALEGLARARARRPLDAEQRRRIGDLQQEHRRASDEYQRLRELYLEAGRPARVPPPAALAFIGDTTRFDLPLAHLLRESRFERLASPDLNRFVDVDRRFARGITAPFDKTLASLATADHRTLTYPLVAELRRHIARLDGVVERLKDAPAAKQIEGRQELGVLLRRMGNLASAPIATRHVEPFRRLLDERRTGIARIAGAQPARPLEVPRAQGALHRLLPSIGEEHLYRLRRLHPGVEKLLREVPESAIAAATQRQPHLTPLERIHHLLPDLPQKTDERYGFMRIETREDPRHNEEPHGPDEPTEALHLVRRKQEHLEEPLVVAPVVPPPLQEEPKRELAPPIPPLPPLEPEPSEPSQVPETPEAVAHPPQHALAKIAHLRGIADQLRRKLHRQEEIPVRPEPTVAPLQEHHEQEAEHERTPLEMLLVARGGAALRHVQEVVEQPPGPPEHIAAPALPFPPPQAPQPILPALPLEILLHEKPITLPHLKEVQEQLEKPAVHEEMAVPHGRPGAIADVWSEPDDARIFVDRAAHRGDVSVDLGDDADPDAVDTWIGSGEGVKLFSEVFGAFLQAAPSEHTPEKRKPARASQPAPHVHREIQRSRVDERNDEPGFFAKLFHKAEDFAQRVVQRVAAAGNRLATEAAHAQDTRRHAIEGVGHAVEGQLHGVAGMAEGFFRGVGLDSAAVIAHRAGSMTDALREHGNSEPKHEQKNQLDEPRRLDAVTLNRMEDFLQGNFKGVRVHTGKGAEEVTSRYGAEAVTVTDHIFFAPGKFNPATLEGERLIAHELTHVLQKERQNLDVRTAESEALRAEHSYGNPPRMETLDLRRPAPDFKLADFTEGEGAGLAHGVHTAKRTRSRRDDAGGKDELPDGDEFLDKVSGRVYELLMEELEESFESR